MTQQRNLVFIANDVGGTGGMETHLEELINRLKHKYRLTVVASSFRLQDKTGVTYVHVPVLRKPFPLMILTFSLFASVKLIRLRRNSIIHTTGAIVFCRSDISTIHFCHAGWKQAVTEGERSRPSLLFKLNHEISVRIKLWFEQHCYKPSRTKRLVPVSKRVARELLDFYPYPKAALSVISNGVDTTRFQPATSAQKRSLRAGMDLPVHGTYAIFVGGDWERKGVRLLLEAFRQLAAEYVDLHVLIVGAGDIEAFERVIPDRFRQRVHFVGRQSNPETWYRLGDIFVFPSNYEACSLAVLEAAASGLAMVLTRVGGADDLVEDGVSGYFVERSADSIANVLRYLLDHPMEIQRIASAARKQVEKHTWDATCRQFEALYDSISLERGEPSAQPHRAWQYKEEGLK